MVEQQSVSAEPDAMLNVVHEKMHVGLKNKCEKLKRVTSNVLLRFKHKMLSNRLH